MGTATDGNATVGPINNLLNTLDKLLGITESRCAVCISEQSIFTPDMSKAVGNSTTLAAVLLQRHNPQDVVKLVLPSKVQHHVHCFVGTAIVDDNDLVASSFVVLCMASLASLTGGDVLGGFRIWSADVLV